MAVSSDTPTKYQVDRISEELRGVHQQLRQLNQKLTEAGYFALLVLSVGFFAFMVLMAIQASDRA